MTSLSRDRNLRSYWLPCICCSYGYLELKIIFFVDRIKIYESEYMDPDTTPEALQRKVQFDIRLYFFRRGSENMESMQKSDFKLEFNTTTESWMVIKTNDELTKNHQEIGNKIAGVMPENKNYLKHCPVRSYVMYNEHLNPENTFLWQTPLKKS